MGELEDEFRPLFVEEAKGHLQRIASGLLALESAPDDQAAIDGIFREAHTMKGAAGMVGMMRVSRLAHRLEDLLVELRAGTRRSSPELTDAMLLVLDGMGRLIASPSSGDQDASDEAALERLLPTSPVSVAVVESKPAVSPQALTPQPAAMPAAAAIPPARPSLTPTTLEEILPHPTAASTGVPAPQAREGASPQVGRPSPPQPPAPAPAPAAPVPPAQAAHLDRKQPGAATLEVPVARIDELNRLVGEASAAQLRVGHA
ncbi:MAG TPA: hypothetical protein DCF65_15195, partial [Chloroflexi bacterium]|nr:hypothetical protein [Chloroflexota bacterium]